MFFLTNPFEKKKNNAIFRAKLEEKLNEYLCNGTIISGDNSFDDEKKKIKQGDISQIKITSEFVNNCNTNLLINILKINKKLKVCYDVKYNVVYSLLLKSFEKRSNICMNTKSKKCKPMTNVYKIKRKNISYFMNQYHIIKCIYSSEYGNTYYCKNVIDNKKYCIKLFYLRLCLKDNCPYYINNKVYLTNYFYKILSEIFFLNYLENNNIINIEQIFCDEKNEILFTIFPYIKHQSMYYKKKHKIYSIYNKKLVRLENQKFKIYLYSENFIKHIFLNIYNTINYLLQKNVAYLDLKPDNILLTHRNPDTIESYEVSFSKKKKVEKRNKVHTSPSSKEIANIDISLHTKFKEQIKESCTKDEYIKSTYANKIFLTTEKNKKTVTSKNSIHNYCSYANLKPEKLKKNKKIKYIYNVNLSKSFEYDKNVKRIFFTKNKLDAFFFAPHNTTTHIQTFIQRKNKRNKSYIIDQSQNSLYKKYEKRKHPNKTYINKIKNLSIFKYNQKHSINFLKFYWLYFNIGKSCDINNDFLVYLDLYFFRKYYDQIGNIYTDILSMDRNQYIEISGIKTRDGNICGKVKKENMDDKEKIQNLDIAPTDDMEKQLCLSKNEINYNNSIKLIDFDACTFIIKSFNIYTRETDMFNSFESLFPDINKKVELSKKQAYNFGSVLYTFLFGTPPYHGKDIFEVYDNMKNNTLYFPKYRKINTDLKNLLRKLLNTKPDKRMHFKKIKQHRWFSKYK
ncbi:protein kinase, putative [Plasmodium chabaudi chabaudi]|uniref:Protein kinase, putative n=1 Tax=Plasmodium chabaudi chabaudi TaxID=31271 RepID=A0A4V6M9M4_PLACU|nr:protein kinase, putative [Plasmodium chabaudi chabaudi]VTZ69997.1 protein kinase, putative [Plasmodium chabaudi chabaudi]|eukprot:XP_016654420.1 protein kinase, putative [Plasmodium chabaudi chabaudi]